MNPAFLQNVLADLPKFLVLFFGVAIVRWVILAILAVRDTISRGLDGVLTGLYGFLGCVYMLHTPPQTGVLAGLALAGVVMLLKKPRSRHIPARIRRKKRAEWEAKTGRKFPSKKLELDHRVPFALGGSHTEDNLRIMERGKNRRKGKKLPGLFE